MSQKIVLALAATLLTGTLSMLVIYRGLRVLHQAMHELADIKEPSSAAAYEMEINVNGIGLGVLKYLENGNPTYRELVADDEKDFEAFHARYLQLAQTDEEKALGEKIGRLYREFQSLGQELMTIRDQQEVFFSRLSRHFDRIDQIIHAQIQARLDLQGHDVPQKLAMVQGLKQDVAEVGLWLLRYQRSQKAQDKQLLLRHETEFRDTLARLKALRLSAEEWQSASMLEEVFAQTMTLARQILGLEDQLRIGLRRFVHLRLEIDAVIDDEIQTLALTSLFAPRREAERETAYVMRTVLLLIPVYILCVVAVAVLLVRTITKPVQVLMRGTQAVSRGDLAYRVDPLGRDEFGELSQHFNHMVTELQASTVSKALLQACETQLHVTVDELRREITARARKRNAPDCKRPCVAARSWPPWALWSPALRTKSATPCSPSRPPSTPSRRVLPPGRNISGISACSRCPPG